MNPELFSPARVTPHDTRNDAGGRAYARSPKAALAQLALVGTFGDRCHQSAKAQLDRVLEYLNSGEISTDYALRLAHFAREQGKMRDLPVFLVCWIMTQHIYVAGLGSILSRGGDFRSAAAIFRSGVLGTRSLPRALRHRFTRWLNTESVSGILSASVGKDPRLADVVRMVHPKVSEERQPLVQWILGKLSRSPKRSPWSAFKEAFRSYPEGVLESCPPELAELLRFEDAVRAGRDAPLPQVDFRLIDHLPLTTAHWRSLALGGGYRFVLKNLNTFERHGVYEDVEALERIAERIEGPEELERAGVLPFEVLAAHRFLSPKCPQRLGGALERALEYSTRRVPEIWWADLVILIDVSLSMNDPAMGTHGVRHASRVRCVDVAALFAAALLRKNPSSQCLCFDSHLLPERRVNPRDTIPTIQRSLALTGGGTACGTALKEFLEGAATLPGCVLIISDSESWADGRGESLSEVWRSYKRRAPGARLVCLDLAPNTTRQVPERSDALNVGGFSDRVWEEIRDFFSGETLDLEALVDRIESSRMP